MAISSHCGDRSPHGPHSYYGPNPDPRKTTQVEYSCPGTSATKPDKPRKPGKK